MRKSHIAMLSAVGVVVLGTVAFASVIRVALSEGAEVREVGDRIDQRLELRGFDRIGIEGSWTVTVRQGAEWAVQVSYPEGVEDDFDVRVEDGRLVLEYARPGFWWFGRGADLDAEIVMPQLSALDLAGAAELDLSGFEGDRLEIDVAGAADMRGRASRYSSLELSVSGAADVDFRDLVVTDARVNLAGASDVTLGMDGGVLSGQIAGAGSVEYFGEVREESVSISGLADVSRGD